MHWCTWLMHAKESSRAHYLLSIFNKHKAHVNEQNLFYTYPPITRYDVTNDILTLEHGTSCWFFTELKCFLLFTGSFRFFLLWNRSRTIIIELKNVCNNNKCCKKKHIFDNFWHFLKGWKKDYYGWNCELKVGHVDSRDSHGRNIILLIVSRRRRNLKYPISMLKNNFGL